MPSGYDVSTARLMGFVPDNAASLPEDLATIAALEADNAALRSQVNKLTADKLALTVELQAAAATVVASP